MNLLCIDTSGSRTCVGACKGSNPYYICDDGFVKASRALMPMIDSALDHISLSLDELDFISVVVGPGSFTGIRIGVTAARALAYVKNLPVVAVNSCELAAYNILNVADIGGRRTIAVSDAGNGYAFAAVYDKLLETVPPTCVDKVRLDELISGYKDPLIAADRKYAEIFGVPPAEGNGIIGLSERKFERGETVDYSKVLPLYVRASQAERGA